jgi:hypothetical protein
VEDDPPTLLHPAVRGSRSGRRILARQWPCLPLGPWLETAAHRCPQLRSCLFPRRAPPGIRGFSRSILFGNRSQFTWHSGDPQLTRRELSKVAHAEGGFPLIPTSTFPGLRLGSPAPKPASASGHAMSHVTDLNPRSSGVMSSRCSNQLRSDRPEQFYPIEPGLFRSPFCSGNAFCPCARVLC